MRRLLEDIRMHLPARHTKVVRVMPSAVEMNAGCAPRCRYTCICTCTVHHRTLAPVLPKTVGTRFCLHASFNAPSRLRGRSRHGEGPTQEVHGVHPALLEPPGRQPTSALGVQPAGSAAQGTMRSNDMSKNTSRTGLIPTPIPAFYTHRYTHPDSHRTLTLTIPSFPPRPLLHSRCNSLA